MSLKIIKAKYGIEGKRIDVADVLNSKIVDGKLITASNNETFDNDPAPHQRKTLVIEYELDGEVKTKEYAEGVLIEIPESDLSRDVVDRVSLNFPEITLVSVCWGNDSYLTSLIWAYRQFGNKTTFGEKMIFVSENINTQEYDEFFEKQGIKIFKVEADFSLEKYNKFIIKNLNSYINTDFVLIFQNDGFISNLGAWTDEFLNYDYIGAPWWYNDENNVGNGGFSLRSKKLMDILAEDDHIEETHPEDHHTCRTYGKYLRDTHGIKFAPQELASRFSVETGNYFNQFGFHSKWHLSAYIKRILA